MNVLESLNAAIAHHRGGNLAEAERIYREVLREQPEQPDALHLLGLIAHQASRHEAAADLIRKAIAVRPAVADFHLNLGEALRVLGRVEEAIACYRSALAINPAMPEAYYNLGVAHTGRGVPEDAERFYRRAIELRPGHAQALNNLANLLGARGRQEEAIATLAQAVESAPGFAEAHNNLGIALKDAGRIEEARAHCLKAIELRPDFAAAISNLGSIHYDLGQMTEAAECFRRALAAAVPPPGVWVNLGKALNEQGRWRDAEDAYRRAFEAEPGAAAEIRLANVVPVIAESHAELADSRRRLRARVGELSRRDLKIPDPLHEVNSVNFYLAYQGDDIRDVQEQMARLYVKASPSLAYVAPHCAGRRPSAKGRKIRVGYVSRLIGQQSVARVLMSGVIRTLPREKFSVQVFSFPHARNADYATMAAAADRVTLMPPVLDAARKAIAAEELDVLCYVDIGMDPLSYFLAFSRLAPLQCASWQHPVTTGIPGIDYYLSSALFEPKGAQAHYTERLVLLEHLPTFYERPPRPETPLPRAQLGLEDSGTAYVCPQSLFKIHPDFDQLFAGILRADPAGTVYLIRANEDNLNEILVRRLRATIPDVAGRIRFLPRIPTRDFQHLLAAADVLLDPPHWSGGITSLDALALGTPIVTLPGALMRGRVTYGIYRQMRMLDCIATSPAKYVELAVRLGRDRTYRESVQRTILAGNAVLYENPAATREFAHFFASSARA